MGLLQFIFSSFWVWLGFAILLAGVVNSIVGMTNVVFQKGRKIAVYKLGKNWRIEIENATEADVVAALREKERINKNEPGTFEQ